MHTRGVITGLTHSLIPAPVTWYSYRGTGRFNVIGPLNKGAAAVQLYVPGTVL